MACETVFTGLKGLVEMPAPSSKDCIIPPELIKARGEILIIPTSEYLTPQLPSVDATKDELENHKVYKANPVLIKSFDKTYQLMPSKEQPKRLKIIGSDEKEYLFLLKNDKYGDSSKEAKFISFFPRSPLIKSVWFYMPKAVVVHSFMTIFQPLCIP